MARFIPNPPGILALKFAPNEIIHKDLLRRTLKVDAFAKQLCPVDTGRLRSSIRFAVVRDAFGLVGVVGTDVKYGIFVHEGTRPHVIRPRSAGALFWKGAEHPVMSVNHPGTRGQPFLRRALTAAGG